MVDELYDIPASCDFNTVYTGSEENACSPILKDKYFSPFSGILINAPKEIIWPKNASPEDFPPGPWGETDGPFRFMVAGLIRLKYNELGLEGDAGGSVLIVAVDQNTAMAYSGRMAEPDVDTEPDFDMDIPDDEPSEEDQNTLLTSHFNSDLIYDLNLPLVDASYTVYATLGEYKSNEITVKTKIE